MNTYSYLVIFAIAIAFLFVVTSASIATAPPDDCSFTLIPVNSDIVYKNIFGIIIDLPYNGKVSDGSVPNTTFTIFPSDEGDGVFIETSPANLVTVGDSFGGKYFNFQWDTDVASSASSGAVRIGIPSDQLQEVWVYDGHNAVISDGFTDITYLVSSGADSILRAEMTSTNSTTSLTLDNFGGEMYIETNIPDTVTVRGFGYEGVSSVQSLSSSDFYVEYDGSELTIEGHDDGADADADADSKKKGSDSKKKGRYLSSSGAQVTVTDRITGNIDVSSDCPTCIVVMSVVVNT